MCNWLTASFTVLCSVPLFATPQSAYTNHAGIAISGVVVSLDRKEVVISNAAEMAKIPLSIFPESERRRIAADYAEISGDISILRVPQDVRRALESTDNAIRRSVNRAAKGLCGEDESREFVKKSRAARKEFLDRAVESGHITQSERKLLE